MEMKHYRNCHLCPRDCGVDRTAGERGVCGESSDLRIAAVGPHHGEEPSFSGARGSGTIFFTGCSCRCFFCQNYQISHEGLGRKYTTDDLIHAAEHLVEQGVHNLNFVTPDHFWPHVAFVCRELRRRGVAIPFLFNSSCYVKTEMVAAYAEHMDIFMPDFKFSDSNLAADCMNDPAYPEIALAALKKMIEIKGFLKPWDPTGHKPATKGVLVRHLVLPGQVENSLNALRILRNEFGPELPLSVMSQFHPVAECHRRKELDRKIVDSELRRVHDLVLDLEFEHVYIQNIPLTDEFLPDFRREKPFRGVSPGGYPASACERLS